MKLFKMVLFLGIFLAIGLAKASGEKPANPPKTGDVQRVAIGGNDPIAEDCVKQKNLASRILNSCKQVCTVVDKLKDPPSQANRSSKSAASQTTQSELPQCYAEAERQGAQRCADRISYCLESEKAIFQEDEDSDETDDTASDTTSKDNKNDPVNNCQKMGKQNLLAYLKRSTKDELDSTEKAEKNMSDLLDKMHKAESSELEKESKATEEIQKLQSDLQQVPVQQDEALQNLDAETQKTLNELQKSIAQQSASIKDMAESGRMEVMRKYSAAVADIEAKCADQSRQEIMRLRQKRNALMAMGVANQNTDQAMQEIKKGRQGLEEERAQGIYSNCMNQIENLNQLNLAAQAKQQQLNQIQNRILSAQAQVRADIAQLNAAAQNANKRYQSILTGMANKAKAIQAQIQQKTAALAQMRMNSQKANLTNTAMLQKLEKRQKSMVNVDARLEKIKELEDEGITGDENDPRIKQLVSLQDALNEASSDYNSLSCPARGQASVPASAK